MVNKIKTFIKYLNKPIPLEEDFEDYDSYWKSRGFHAPSLKRAEIISKYISPNKRILDVGCGDGTMIEILSDANAPKDILGIDISKFAVQHVKSKGYKAKVVDVLSDGFIKLLNLEKFDYIVITEVLEHIQDPESVIENIKKYQPNATLFISIPNSGFIMHRLRLLFGKFPLVMINNHVKEHIRFWTYLDFKYWTSFFSYKVKRSFVSSTSKVLSFDLGRLIPSLFAKQIIYELVVKDVDTNKETS